MRNTNAKYQIRFVEQIKNPNYGKGGTGSGDKFIGGDDFFIKEIKSRATALEFGKKQSLRKTIEDKILHEIYIRFEDENNKTGELYFIKNGRIIHEDNFEL